MSPTCGETSVAVEATTEHAVEGGKNQPDGEEKNPAEEKAGDGVGTHINPNSKDVKEQSTSGSTLEEPKHLVCAEKTEKTQVLADIEEPKSEGGSARINKEQTYVFAVPEQKDVPEKPQLKKNKEKKRKRSELEQINIEEQLGGAEKKRSELVQIKIEGELGGAEKIQVPAGTEEAASETCCPQRWLASYSTLLHTRKKVIYKGSIRLNSKMNRVALRKKILTSWDGGNSTILSTQFWRASLVMCSPFKHQAWHQSHLLAAVGE